MHGILYLFCYYASWANLDAVYLNHNALDEMGSKIDELEESINDLKAEMGAEGAIKPKPEEPRPPEESA